jgi:hypothetical protein
VEKQKFMKYNNVQPDKTKVKQFIIDTWELEDNLFMNKKKIDEKEKEEILEKDNTMLLNSKTKNEVVLERNRQFSFQHISKSEKKDPQTNIDKQDKKEIGGLLKAIGRVKKHILMLRYKRNFE